jgi:hypothetical protein
MLSHAGCSTVKVDCDKMCSRAFKECATEVVIAAKKGTAESQAAVEKAGQLPKLQEAGYQACMKSCKKNKGMGSDAAKINECLEKKDCKAFAECFTPYLK